MTHEPVVLDTPAALATSTMETVELMNNLYIIGCSLNQSNNIPGSFAGRISEFLHVVGRDQGGRRSCYSAKSARSAFATKHEPSGVSVRDDPDSREGCYAGHKERECGYTSRPASFVQTQYVSQPDRFALSIFFRQRLILS